MTYTKTFDCFLLNDSLPIHIHVRDTVPPEDATRTYSVVADYGWAETILCSGSYFLQANDIARVIAEHLDIPVTLGDPGYCPDGEFRIMTLAEVIANTVLAAPFALAVVLGRVNLRRRAAREKESRRQLRETLAAAAEIRAREKP